MELVVEPKSDRFEPSDPRWRDQLWFHEYFHGDTGAGLGASHQTGWTGLVARLVRDIGHRAVRESKEQQTERPAPPAPAPAGAK